VNNKRIDRPGRWLIILPPLLFLLIFFLIPFAAALKISFAETAARVPPFTDILRATPDHHLHLVLSFANYKYLLTDEVYGVAYLYSLRTAFFSGPRSCCASMRSKASSAITV
jgi:putrescine transport system permease protein